MTTISITHYAADRDFYMVDSVSDDEYRAYVEAYAEAVRAEVAAAYPEAAVESEIDWREASMSSKAVSVSGVDYAEADEIREDVERIAAHVWDRQDWEPVAVGA